jgi:hypothetical protein
LRIRGHEVAVQEREHYLTLAQDKVKDIIEEK